MGVEGNGSGAVSTAGASGSVDGSGGAAVSTAGVSDASAGTGSVTSANTGTSTQDWFTGLSNPDHRGYAQKKGWSNPESVVESYRNLEKLIGVKERLVTLPESVEDKDGWNAVFNRLGRPEKADGYQLNLGEKPDEKFAGWAKGTFYDLGLNQNQAAALTDRWNAYVADTEKAAGEERRAQFEQQENALRSEWGAAYDKHLNVAKRAANELGIKAEVIDKLEEVMGHAGVMKFMHSVGSKFSEGSFVRGEAPNFSGPVTPEQARHEINTLKKDAAWSQKFLAGDADARKRWSQLHKWTFPEQTQ